MILFDNWRIKYVGELLAHQYDNLSRTLLVKGVPDGYDWAMMVQIKEYFDVIALAPMGEGVGVVLTEEQLSLDGYYSMQLVGTLKDDGVTKRHTNALQVYVGASLSGDANWPEVPSEFSQMEDRIRELNSHPPVPGTQGYWLIWDPDKDAYVESELPLPEGSGGGSVDVDTTLTQSGKAADAAAVGDALSSLSEEIASVPGGKDGVSPTASVEQIEGGVVLTVEDARGTTTATLHDGATGPAGPQGETGPQGEPGADGLGVPAATAEDAGKVPVVQEDGTYGLANIKDVPVYLGTIPVSPDTALYLVAPVKDYKKVIIVKERTSYNDGLTSYLYVGLYQPVTKKNVILAAFSKPGYSFAACKSECVSNDFAEGEIVYGNNATMQPTVSGMIPHSSVFSNSVINQNMPIDIDSYYYEFHAADASLAFDGSETVHVWGWKR